MKKDLKKKIMEISEDFGLDEIIINGYVRQFDSQSQISATDMAYAIASLLDHPAATLKEQENNNPNEKKQSLAKSVLGVHDCLYDNFWVAYDALDLKQHNMGILLKGIELAKDMQIAIVRVGVSLIEKKDIKLANSFRYCIIENSYLKDIALFQYPLALHKLALFIMSAYKVSR